MPKHIGAQEKGHLYPAEPKQYNKGETGKGVNIGGGHKEVSGSVIKVGGDNYAAKLRSVWSKALGAAKKFPTGI